MAMKNEIQVDTKIFELPKNLLPPDESFDCIDHEEIVKPNLFLEKDGPITTPDVKRVANIVPKHAKTYDIGSFEKNLMVIFNQEDIIDQEYRYGSEHDVTKLTETFKKFNFKIVVCPNFQEHEIEDILNKYETENLKSYGCFAIVVLTHGEKHGELWAQDKKYSESKIINCFKNNKSLVTKPKILLIQACRGNDLSPKSDVRPDSTLKIANSDYYALPVEADFLIVHSTFPGNYSHRGLSSGSWFIQTLCAKINELAATHHLESIVREVKRDVAINECWKVPTDEIPTYDVKKQFGSLEEVYNKQVPVLTSTLIRKLYLKEAPQERNRLETANATIDDVDGPTSKSAIELSNSPMWHRIKRNKSTPSFNALYCPGSSTEDECDQFGRLVSIKLRALTSSRRNEAQNEVFDMLTGYTRNNLPCQNRFVEICTTMQLYEMFVVIVIIIFTFCFFLGCLCFILKF